MPDMLVKLYDLPTDNGYVADMAAKGIVIRKPIAPEKHLIEEWIGGHFGPGWASEFDASMSNRGVFSFIATAGEQLIGFGCHNSTAPGFFGPTGVLEAHRGKGIGKALLLACLQEMRQMGFGYAIIGGAGPTGFYEKVCGAVAIPGSAPGIYAGMLNPDKQV